MQKINRPIEVLLVEDNIGDSRLIQESFKDLKVPNILHIVKDGVEALQFLKKEDSFKDSVRPDIILLDLNLPRKNGFEVLSEIKQDEDLRTIPVIILTSSKSEIDIAKAYKYHANSYVNKPNDFLDYLKISEILEDFWFSTSVFIENN